MPGVLVRLSSWTRKTTTSFVDLCLPREAAKARDCAADHLIYRLRHWPRIASTGKTVDIYRTLSVMSSRPVNRRWILNNSSMDAREVDLLLRRLVEQEAVDIVDAGKFRPDTHAA